MLVVAIQVLLWLVFAGTHVGLAVRPVRSRLVALLGDLGYAVLFTSVASVTFTGWSMWLASHRYEGPAGLALGGSPYARPVLVATSLLGVALMIAAFAPRGYWRSPLVVFRAGDDDVFGIERIVRHPFFTGTVLLAASHVLLASHLMTAVYFGGLIVLAVGGTAHQTRKIRAERGEAYDRYLAATSSIPFLAVATGRQRIVLAELPWVFLAIGLAFAVALRVGHAWILVGDGAYYAAVVVGGSLAIGVVTYIRARWRLTASQGTR